MARRPTLLIVSLLANLTLGTALLCLHRTGRANITAAPAPSAATTASTADTVPSNAVWSKIDARPNDPGYAESLRRLGFPERVVRSLVRYRLEEEFHSEIRDLMSETERRPYWQRTRYSEGLTEAGRARMRAISYEIDTRSRAILGPAADTALPGDYGEGELHRYGNLSPQKISALKAIKRDYSELSNEIEESSQGILFPEDREKLAYLKREEQSDIARLLTPEELDQYERRSSTAAYTTRNELQYLDNVTEDDFLKIYHLRQDFDQRYGISYLSPAQEKTRDAAQTELQAQIQAALGPERYVEYQLVNDNSYRTTRDFVVTAGLSPDLAKPLASLQRDCIDKSKSTRSDTSLTSEQRAAELQKLVQEAREAIRAKIGEEKFAVYQRSPAGSWLTKLASSRDKTGK